MTTDEVRELFYEEGLDRRQRTITVDVVIRYAERIKNKKFDEAESVVDAVCRCETETAKDKLRLLEVFKREARKHHASGDVIIRGMSNILGGL